MNRLISWLKQKDRIAYLVYSALALFILFPLLKSGFVFAIDMVFTPQIRLAEQFNLLNVVLYLLNFILPSSVIQKIIMFLIIFLAGLGMHKLIPSKNIWPKCFAGIFYIFNPFVYSRFLYGHLFILLAYALFPFAIKAIFNFFENPKRQNFLKLFLWFLLISIISLHIFALLLLFFGIAFIFYFFKRIKDRKKFLKLIAFCLLIFILLSFWLILFFKASKSVIPQSVSNFDKRDLEAFQTVEDKTFGLPLNVLALYGFWGDDQNQYIVQKAFTPWWPILALIIFILVFWGLFIGFREKRKDLRWKTGIFFTVSIISFILAIGIAWKPIKPFIQFLYDHIPFYYGFREPQKFVALLCFTYCFLGATGIDDILKKFKQKRREILYSTAAIIFIALPFFYSPGLFRGFRNQLYTSHYPQEWYEVNDLLNQDQEDFKVLFLPWHLYMRFDFAGKNITNPAFKFFDKNIISGDNMQISNIETHSEKIETKYVEKFLHKRTVIKNFGYKLKPLEIKYIILAKEVDYEDYTKLFLNKQEDLEVIYEKGKLKIYKNKAVDDLQ